jgi:hypothetical protein
VVQLRSDDIKPDVLKNALAQTSEKRGSRDVMRRYDSILSDVLASEQMQGFWKKYQTDSSYAADIGFDVTVETAKEILEVATSK